MHVLRTYASKGKKNLDRDIETKEREILRKGVRERLSERKSERE